MSESEYEEEEFVIFADFKNQLLLNKIAEPKTAIKIIGIESKNPIAEIDGNIFKGTYDYAMGTNVFFERDSEATLADPLFETNCRQKYKYFGKTNKVINFQRASMDKKADEAKSTSNELIATEEAKKENSLKVNMTYEEVIRQFPGTTDS